MSRNDLVVRLVAAFVGVVAIAFAAATISSPTNPDGSGGGGGGGGSGLPGGAPDPGPGGGGGLPPFFQELLLALVVVVAIVLAWYYLHNRRELVMMLGVAAGVVLAFALVIYAAQNADLGFLAESGNQSPMGENNSSGPGEGEGGGDSNRQPFDFDALLPVLAAGTVLLVGVFAFSRWRKDDAATATGHDLGTAEETAAVGAAAGRAADRIESDAEAVENEIYRAWQRMTDHLEVERPETSTPREFATAAVEAEMAREHVDELTRLFEDVRYGHAETTADREERAVAVLRRIETEYADLESADSDPTTAESEGESS